MTTKPKMTTNDGTKKKRLVQVKRRKKKKLYSSSNEAKTYTRLTKENTATTKSQTPKRRKSEISMNNVTKMAKA
ncbi:hypothetical protein F8M41_017243 [Gigaspora margarita]|uniref:Uncharacterized protein n=1 Tax=Gigaspora margarita TaxID=4874 RepID=A0A8H4ANB0_GIGMA|nr:hypothetical protein F8M41_017243 [Gigaspora margarita]